MALTSEPLHRCDFEALHYFNYLNIYEKKNLMIEITISIGLAAM